jgi:hypothetical protein
MPTPTLLWIAASLYLNLKFAYFYTNSLNKKMENLSYKILCVFIYFTIVSCKTQTLDTLPKKKCFATKEVYSSGGGDGAVVDITYNENKRFK